MNDEPAIRPMRSGDAPAVAALATQLGYPSAADQVRRRLSKLGQTDGTAVVAEVEGRVAAWLHVEMRYSLVADREAQIMALVVDEGCRGRGIGSALMRHAERWAADHGADTVRVGSRITRTDAHRFYEAIGYELSKTSHWFHKRLAG
jgi:GNAT superfamily N-acetyltransferase